MQTLLLFKENVVHAISRFQHDTGKSTFLKFLLILLDASTFIQRTHITRDMCFPGRGTHITRDMCFQVEEHKTLDQTTVSRWLLRRG